MYYLRAHEVTSTSVLGESTQLMQTITTVCVFLTLFCVLGSHMVYFYYHTAAPQRQLKVWCWLLAEISLALSPRCHLFRSQLHTKLVWILCASVSPFTFVWSMVCLTPSSFLAESSWESPLLCHSLPTSLSSPLQRLHIASLRTPHTNNHRHDKRLC